MNIRKISRVDDAPRYFMPLQAEYAASTARAEVTEKANRIGWTWTDAYKNVRKRLHHAKRDYLLTTQNWNGALEYGRYVEEWIALYNLGSSIISRSEETIEVHEMQADGSKLAMGVKVGIYLFDNRSRIILFPSNPWALQTFEGDVGWDEAAFHEQQAKMWAAIATRLQWGYDVSVWSAHNGVGSWFNQVLIKMASKPGSVWRHRKVTIYDAIADGLVEKINAKNGTHTTRDEFLATCRELALTPEIWAERFEVAPCDSGSNITPWSVVEAAAVSRGIVRVHLSNEQIRALFGAPELCDSEAKIKQRITRIQEWLKERFGHLSQGLRHFRLGYDVAASEKGDLGSIWIAEKVGARLRQVALLTMQTPDWNFHRGALFFFMGWAGMRGAGDCTGLGREISWSAAQLFGGRFAGVPFTRASKGALGSHLMGALTSHEFEMAASDEHADIAMDIYGLQKHVEGGALVFTATTNQLNPASHGDIAWSAALAIHADKEVEGGGAFGFGAMPPKPQSLAARLWGGMRRGRRLP